MARTLSEDEYDNLVAKVDNYEHALRRIRRNALTDDDGAWNDPYSSLERILDITTSLKEDGFPI